MAFRRFLCVVLLFAGGYASNSSDHCHVLVNYDTFKTSVDQFLASWNDSGDRADKSSENQTAYLTAMTQRVNDLEKQVEKLLNDNENKASRLSYLEAVLANLTLTIDCGTPPSLEDTYFVFGSMAHYKCTRGLVGIHNASQAISLCQSDGNWTMVNLTCVNLSSCWMEIDGGVFYTGNASTSISGRDCQRWDSLSPHGHRHNVDHAFYIPGYEIPQTTSTVANHCRDPDGSGYPWCYTTDPDLRWESCGVPQCNE